MLDKDVKTYLDDISRYLVCTNKQKKIILEDIEISVRDYTENANVKNMSEVYNHFGSPEDIAKAYLANFVKPTDIRKAVSKKKVLIIAILIALVIFATGIITIVIENNKEHGYIVESPVNETILDNSKTNSWGDYVEKIYFCFSYLFNDFFC